MEAIALDATPLGSNRELVSSHLLRGIGRYVESTVRSLITEQPDWASRNLRPVIADGAPSWITGPTVTTRRARRRAKDTAWLFAAAADRIAARRHTLSLWHSTDPTLPFPPLGADRSAVTVYDLIPLHEPAVMARVRPHRRSLYRLYLRLVRRARLVIAISHHVADDVNRTLGVPADRIHVVYPAVIPRAVEPLAVAPRTSISDLLFVGVPAPHKGADSAVAALAEIRRRGPAVRLRFVGHHPPRDRARLIAAAAANGVGDAVEFVGRVTDDQLSELYGQSVLLALSRTEGLGLPPIEALMARGRAVVGSAPVFREALGDAVDYAHPEDAAAVADAYERAVARPVLASAPQQIVDRFSPRACAAASVAAYESASANR